MGRDKALLEVGGRPLIACAAGQLQSLGITPRICGSRPDLAGFAEVIPDNHAGCGPLGGIEAALTASGTDLSLFIPVDLPNLPSAFLRWMALRAASTEAVATLPHCGGRAQPLCAVYSRRLLPGLRAALASGNYRMMEAVAAAAASLGERVDEFQVETIAAALVPGVWPAAPPPGDWFRNLNTPADYERFCTASRNFEAGANRRHPIS